MAAYQAFADDPGFAKVATISEVLQKDGKLSIPRYVRPIGNGATKGGDQDLKTAWTAFDASGREFWQQMDVLVDMLGGAVAEETGDV